MINNQAVNNLINTGPGILLKWMTVTGLIMYAIFAIVVVRQTAIMTETLESEVNQVVKLLAWLQLGAAIALVVIAAVWL